MGKTSYLTNDTPNTLDEKYANWVISNVMFVAYMLGTITLFLKTLSHYFIPPRRHEMPSSRCMGIKISRCFKIFKHTKVDIIAQEYYAKF